PVGVITPKLESVPPVNIVITEDKKIRFHGEDYEVVPFIESCLIRLRIFINEAYDVLENC
ncbi:hypothetical protein ACKLKC_19295, partial [Enterobacter sp. MGH 38]